MNVSYFCVRHIKTVANVDFFTTDNSPSDSAKEVQNKRDEYGKDFEVVNLSVSRYKDLIRPKRTTAK